ncbi:hypothetical protein [Arthrobacter sp. UM1]|uniref:hypothetical protein n=1 Tax=Arthrobacter sp. UM1 TaxID=2766776 RepID=UPI001CF64948|nr:hypothetical protein [Arthrobacter sp. UM1]MCB4207494.1 hypothetical protein [Arthrobacter sp. UM1]
MFETEFQGPVAIAQGSTHEGVAEGVLWADEQMRPGQKVTCWFPSQATYTGELTPRSLDRTPGFQVCISKDVTILNASGPVLAFYANPKDISRLMATRDMTALCVLYWSDPLETWSELLGAQRLTTHIDPTRGLGREEEPPLTDGMIEALDNTGTQLNQSNSVDGGYEKRDLLNGLKNLKTEYGQLPASRMAQWAMARGWKRDNPMRLEQMVKDLNAGKQLRAPRI